MVATKRAVADSASADVDAKRQRSEEARKEIASLVNKLEVFVGKAKGIEAKIAKEQVAVHRKYWTQLKAIYKERDAVIEAESKLWGSLICGHPHVASEYLVSPIEVPFLQEYLAKVDLEDFIDDNGSYEVTFTFKESASNLIKPLVWTKRVIMEDDCETVDEEKTVCTKIEFVTDDFNPIKGVEQMKKSAMGELQDAVEDAEDLPIYSVATWFSESKASIAGDFGEIFRKFIYPQPEQVIQHLAEADDDEDDDSDDESTSEDHNDDDEETTKQ